MSHGHLGLFWDSDEDLLPTCCLTMWFRSVPDHVHTPDCTRAPLTSKLMTDRTSVNFVDSHQNLCTIKHLRKKLLFFFSLKNPSKWISWLNKQFDCLLCWATWSTELGMEFMGWQSLCILLNTPLKCSWISLCATHTPYIIQHRIFKPPLCLTWQWTNQPSKPNGVSNNFEENYVRKKKTCRITLTLQIQ